MNFHAMDDAKIFFCLSTAYTNRAKLVYSAIMPINVLFVTVLQAYWIFLFTCCYVIPVSVFAYCYGRIYLTIRRQSNVVRSQASRSHDIPIATTSRDPDTGQVQQQATGATNGAKLTRTELNVLKTMIYVVVCFIICWTPNDISAALRFTEVSI